MSLSKDKPLSFAQEQNHGLQTCLSAQIPGSSYRGYGPAPPTPETTGTPLGPNRILDARCKGVGGMLEVGWSLASLTPHLCIGVNGSGLCIMLCLPPRICYEGQCILQSPSNSVGQPSPQPAPAPAPFPVLAGGNVAGSPSPGASFQRSG